MQQLNPTNPDADDAQRAEPIRLKMDDLQKVVGGTGQPTSPSVIVVVDPEW